MSDVKIRVSCEELEKSLAYFEGFKEWVEKNDGESLQDEEVREILGFIDTTIRAMQMYWCVMNGGKKWIEHCGEKR